MTLGLVLVHGASILGAQSPPRAEPEIRFAPGDALRIQVWERAEFSGEFEIMTDGRLAHPLLKELVVGGRTYEEVRDDVVAFVERFQRNPQIIVVPLRRVSVGGSVVNPGIVSVDPRTTLLGLLGHVGGPSPNAKVTHARVVRTGQRIQIPLWDSPESEKTLLELDLRSGDQVIFPEVRSIWSRYVVPFSGVATTILTLAQFIYLLNRL